MKTEKTSVIILLIHYEHFTHTLNIVTQLLIMFIRIGKDKILGVDQTATINQFVGVHILRYTQ